MWLLAFIFLILVLPCMILYAMFKVMVFIAWLLLEAGIAVVEWARR